MKRRLDKERENEIKKEKMKRRWDKERENEIKKEKMG